MKKILMVLAATLICSTCLFISCQKDVGPDVPATLLVKATGETASKTYSSDYSYDNQGRCIKEAYSDPSETVTDTYSYSEDQIIWVRDVKSEEDGDYTNRMVIELDNQGRFKKGVDEGKERSFFYDVDGHLIKDATVYADAPSNISEQEFVWKDGDMLKHIATFEVGNIHSTSTTEYTYGEKPYQLHPQDGFILWNGIVFTRALGKMPVHQPVSCSVTTVRNIGGKISTIVKTKSFDYQYDANGRIVGVDIFVNEDISPDTKLTFIWK